MQIDQLRQGWSTITPALRECILRAAQAADTWERAQAAYTAWFQSEAADETGRFPEHALNEAEDALRVAVEMLRANLHHPR